MSEHKTGIDLAILLWRMQFVMGMFLSRYKISKLQHLPSMQGLNFLKDWYVCFKLATVVQERSASWCRGSSKTNVWACSTVIESSSFLKQAILIAKGQRRFEWHQNFGCQWCKLFYWKRRPTNGSYFASARNWPISVLLCCVTGSSYCCNKGND